jgi:putative membrane protein
MSQGKPNRTAMPIVVRNVERHLSLRDRSKLNLHNSAAFSSIFFISSTEALAQPSAPADAQGAGIVVAACAVDIDAGKLAENQSENAEVRLFARQMVTNHGAVAKQASALLKKLNVTATESDASKRLKEAGMATIAKLKGLKGEDFGRAYIDNEVSYHQAVVLDAIDKKLISNTKNGGFKETLLIVRSAFAAHLEHAKHLQEVIT